MEEKNAVNKLVDHIFRHESGKLVAVLTRIFGSENLAQAEDLVQESLIEAIRHWTYKGIPEDPGAWLYRVARNKALNLLKREQLKHKHKSSIIESLHPEQNIEPKLDFLFSEKQIVDDQLRMIFTCCHPAISVDSQIALALKTLCGFSIEEIARAFLTNRENINKRLVRARQKIRKNNILFTVPQGQELKKRLKAVLETIYFLFNEGYKASSGQDLIKNDVVEEAIRLAEIVAKHPAITDKNECFALLALMYLNASRFKARQNAAGNIITLDKQDRNLWEKEKIRKGFSNLQKSNPHFNTSKYHILALISAYHCAAKTFERTNWQGILFEYDRLLQIDNSPIVLLNRAIALGKAISPQVAIASLKEIEAKKQLENYHLYYSVKGSFQIELKQYRAAIKSLNKAFQLATLEHEKALLEDKISFCQKKIPR